MKRLRLALLASLATGLFPALARASAPVGEEALDLLLKSLNLVLLFGVIAWFGREPIRRFFAERRQTISHDLAQASKLLGDAEKKFGEWERRLSGLDAELDAIREQGRARAEAERGRILAEATAAAERIRRDAVAAAAQELRRARAELRAEAADLAVTLAGGLLKERMTPPDGDRLIDDFVAKVDPAAAPARGGA